MCWFSCKYGDPSVDVRDTNPGTVANPTKTSCLLKIGSKIAVHFTVFFKSHLGKEIPQGAAGLLALDIWVVKLFSFPLHASIKKSFGLPTRSCTSQTSVTKLSMFQVLFPSLDIKLR